MPLLVQEELARASRSHANVAHAAGHTHPLCSNVLALTHVFQQGGIIFL